MELTVSNARTVRLPKGGEAPPLLPWPLAAIGGGAVTALSGALLVAGVMLLAWLSAIAVPVPVLLRFAGQVWLLGNGGRLVLGSDQVSLIPLGLVIGFVAMCASVGRFAFRQGQLSRPELQTDQQRLRLAAWSALQVAVGYTGFALALAWALPGSGTWRVALGSFAISCFGSFVGAISASGLQPWLAGPQWWRDGLRGAVIGALAMVILAAVMLGGVVALAEPQVSTLEDALGLDPGGVVVWALVMLAYLPNLLIWVLSWLFGAGLTFGSGSVISVTGTQLGMLPDLPILGALPEVGVGDLWLQAWLATGVVLGALAGAMAVPDRRRSLGAALAAGGVAGGLLGGGFLVWAALSRGDLGHLRLVELGPRLFEAMVIGVPLLLLPAVIGAAGAWFVRQRWSKSESDTVPLS